MLNQTPYGRPLDYSNAYYLAELEEFFRTGVLNSGVKGFFEKFADNIKELAIIDTPIPIPSEVSGTKLNKAVFEQLLVLFKNLKSLKLSWMEVEGGNWNDLGKFARNIETFSIKAHERNNELISFAKSSKQLKSLNGSNVYFRKEDLDNFANLEEINF